MNDILDLARLHAIPTTIVRNPCLREIAATMPAVAEQIVRAAFACKPAERQQTYERLKQQYAEQSEHYLELGPQHYEAMLLLIDWMLPDVPSSECGEEE